MSVMEDVLKIGKKLEKMVSSETQDHAAALDMLKSLKKLPMTLDVLQKTRVGVTLNNFRKSSNNEEVISLAKSLIKSWKKLLPADNSSSQSSSQSLSRTNSTTSSASKDEDMERSEEAKSEKSEDAAEESSSDPPKKTFPASADDTSDPIRIKCREMMSTALRTSEIPDGSGNPEEIAASIEQCIHKEFGNTDSKYKNRVRSRFANLKDSKNPTLRENVLLGHISPDKIAVMTAEEMANDEMKKLRAKFTKESIDDHQMAMSSGTKTDLLKCGKCLKRNCTYNQVQTRSADEPMTTFVFCNECGHRWKFC